MKNLLLTISLALLSLTAVSKEKEVTKVISNNVKIEGKIVSATITYFYKDGTKKVVKFK